ncbi:hypothetical protein PHISP_07792, partial [Aspergillus sp. HF37]
MTLDQSPSGPRGSTDARPIDDKHQDPESRRPKKLIFAPGDIAATPDLKIQATETADPSSTGSTTSPPPSSPPASHPSHPSHLEPPRSDTSTPS